ncbi:glycosyltransferase family 2 protein [Providencia stuartii]|uniref:glycosyltransferase family 2 protein n=1 Tax=Providencia TaxID=586 RepID=UPI00201E09FB|nr:MULTISPECIES: glycosyltransferase family 2 protein [unclassified Providencia]UQZ12825.1 glycosyltransferase family 2 protein [Providencia stuartii]WER21839.1 glycosyltransferase family 2 protein [Providencia stuartii]WER25960.1 glycosyltransferase family 2 protein [Providencia stuartii]WER30049.1 glycosyltransferase family 2 protein [Providencia stuartii]HEM8303428.1 glycosyltransferase family 2 protein [Providencia stuartii]
MEYKSLDILVSIIVPAYNVEKYITKCLASIFEQTYKNIEVIIINDGSTDNTYKIVNSCIKNEKRARVLNTPNSGVSSARNRGIKESIGEYIVFVDGDDYLANDFVSYMLELITNSDADFCFSKNCYTRKIEQQVKKEKIEILNTEEAISLLLSPNVVVGCWNKIYKRSLIESKKIFFSEDLFYGEGLTFIINIAQSCQRICVGNKKVYYYRKNNETSATTKFEIEKVYNGEKALINIREHLPKKSKMINTMFNYHLCLYRLGALVKLKSNKLEKNYLTDYNRWLKYIRYNSFKFLFFNKLSLYRKLLIIAGAFSPFLVSKLDKIRRKNIINNSVDG